MYITTQDFTEIQYHMNHILFAASELDRTLSQKEEPHGVPHEKKYQGIRDILYSVSRVNLILNVANRGV